MIYILEIYLKMAQYIDKDKVIEYIKQRLIPTVNHGNIDDWERGADNERINFLSYINSLTEEPTVKGITWKDVNTLHTLINQVRHEFPNGISEESFGLAVLERFNDYQDDVEEPVSKNLEKEKKNYSERYERIAQTEQFKKSYCGKSLGKEEPVSENLEEAADKYAKEQYPWQNGYEKWELPIRDFKAGAEWQKQQDYKMYAHVPLKEIHDTWQELKKNKPDIENYPAVCFQKGADWRENHMKELLITEYEKGRFNMREELLKDTADATIKFKYLNGSQNNTIT